MKKCNHDPILKYSIKWDVPKLEVYAICNNCKVRGESFRIEIDREDLRIKKIRAFKNLEHLLENKNENPPRTEKNDEE